MSTSTAVLDKPARLFNVSKQEVASVVKQTDTDAPVVSALERLTESIEKLEKASQEKPKQPSTAALVSIAGLALVVGAYIVTISMYNASLAGEIKNQQTQIEYLKTGNTDLKERINGLEKKTDEEGKAIQTLREMYFLEFGRKPKEK